MSKAVILPHHHIHLYLLQRIEQIALICVTPLKNGLFTSGNPVVKSGSRPVGPHDGGGMCTLLLIFAKFTHTDVFCMSGSLRIVRIGSRSLECRLNRPIK